MKIFKITTVYPAYIDYFYNKNPGLKSASYTEQKDAFRYDAYAWVDVWSHVLAPFGYEVTEIDANIKPLQTAWAHEQGIKFHHRSWMREIVLAQIEHYKPDIVFVQTHALLSKQWLRDIKKSHRSVKKIVTWVGSPIISMSHFSNADAVVTCIPEKIGKFKKAGIRCFQLDHAFDPRILDRIDLQKPPGIDLSFVGQIVRTSRFHLGRDRLLNKLISGLDLTIFSPSSALPLDKWIKFYLKRYTHHMSQTFRIHKLREPVLHRLFSPEMIQIIREKPLSPINPRLKPYLHPPVFGLDMYQTLRDSKITLNTHIDVSPHSASNMRLFEATGVGTCLLTDWKKNLCEMFDTDTEVVTYKSADECIEKATWLLNNPDECRKIASAGQRRTLRDHTFEQRAIIFDQVIRDIVS